MPHIGPFLKVSFLAAIAAIFLFPLFKCNQAMENDMCKALIEDNRQELQKSVNNFLRKLPRNSNDQDNFDRVSDWISRMDCVESVQSSPALLDTEPPVKQFIITLKGKEEPTTIGILLQKHHWTFRN